MMIEAGPSTFVSGRLGEIGEIAARNAPKLVPDDVCGKAGAKKAAI